MTFYAAFNHQLNECKKGPMYIFRSPIFNFLEEKSNNSSNFATLDKYLLLLQHLKQ